MIGWVHDTVSVQQLTSLALNSLDNAFSFHSVLEVTGVENLILLTIFAYNSVLEFWWSGEPNSLDTNFLFNSVVGFAGVKNPSRDGKEKG
jgi:hypothetical protein